MWRILFFTSEEKKEKRKVFYGKTYTYFVVGLIHQCNLVKRPVIANLSDPQNPDTVCSKTNLSYVQQVIPNQLLCYQDNLSTLDLYAQHRLFRG